MSSLENSLISLKVHMMIQLMLFGLQLNMQKAIKVLQKLKDLKTAKIFVMPLGGKNADEIIEKLKEFSFVIRKVLSKKIMVKFMPKLFFVNDDSFDYAEKIENLIRQTQK